MTYVVLGTEIFGESIRLNPPRIDVDLVKRPLSRLGHTGLQRVILLF